MHYSFVRACAPLLSLLCAVFIGTADAAASPRERLLMDFGWKFHPGNEWGSALNLTKAGYSVGPAQPDFSDASWRDVDLPHDWANELPFDPKASEWQGFKAIGRGFPQNSEAWYRRAFVLPESDAGKRLWVEFDGVMRNCTVFFNGWLLGKHESGYTSFRFEITDLANMAGTNLLAVKVDASEPEGWFYEGAGIYRHVWLVKTAPLAVAPDGVFVYSRSLGKPISEAADVRAEILLRNSQASPVEAVLKSQIIGPDGVSVAQWEQKTDVAPYSDERVLSHATLGGGGEHKPKLWSPETPNLYKLITTVESGGKIVDRVETEFGIRTVTFDKDRGFLLNGEPYVIKGTCNHENHAGVGAAVPDAVHYFRVAKLKEMGSNAYRVGHHAPTKEILQACDRLGMIVLNENRLLGSDDATMAELERLVVRDRNHPSIIAWSLGNEEWVQSSEVSGRVGESMQRRVKQLDPTRPVTYASHVGDVPGINRIIEVRGWNYTVRDIDAYRRAHPGQPQLGTEQSSATATRGIYETDKTRGYVSAYDTNYPGWGSSAERWWTFFSERPWLSGGFVWTGFDYRGEPTPYGWPCISSHFGLMDMCGFPKDTYYYYQSWWSTNRVLHLFPHWNWAGREGEEMDVRTFSNCDEVELFLNGKSLGRQPVKKNSHVRWNVKYAPGTLSAVGYTDGRPVLETKRETTGVPTAIQLTPDRVSIHADGEDVSLVTVDLRDAQGRLVPTAMNKIRFELDGPGKIIGVGNGDPSCHEPDVFVTRPPMRSVPLNDWRWKPGVDARKAGIPEYGTQFDDSAWETIDVNAEYGPLDGDSRGVFRTVVNLADADIASRNVELRLNSIDDWCWVYVNGQKAGESRDGNVPLLFDIKPYLRAGENTIAVGILNIRAQGGINKGVTLQFQGGSAPVQWSRSAFNGLAQVLVQSTKEPGRLKLTAHGEGLKAATVEIESKPCVPRPAL
ncbi:MAG TPA: beta-galactosidase GalA [Verrucomicrobiota bacterium]|nr:beta-galactosidase GalA [Verrucomicrobiota bacterium]